MFEEIITEAAELLAENQLGLNRRKDSDKGKLPEILVSFRQIFENELTEQFLKVCATMKVKYQIRKLAPETLHAIAIELKDIVEDAVNGGDTVSVSSIFQNKAIIEVAEKECSEQKRKENNNFRNPENTNINEIGSENKDSKLAEEKIESREQAEKVIGGISKTLAKASEIINEINEDNIEEKVKELRELSETEEAQAEERREIEALEYVAHNGTDKEKRQAQDALNNKRERIERNKKTSEEQKKTRSEVSSILFGFMKDAYNPLYSKHFDQKQWVEKIRNEITYAVMRDDALLNEERMALKTQLEKCSSIDEITKILAQKMSELAVERGNKPIDIATLQKNAKDAVHPRDYKDIEFDSELKSRDITLSENYAQMFLDDTGKERISLFIQQINSNNPDDNYDFTILDEIKKVDKDFYFSMLRNIGVAARENKNSVLQNKLDELINEEVESQLYYQNCERVIRSRERLTPEQQRKTIIGVLHNFLINTYHSNKSIDRLKSELEVFIAKDEAFTNEEKKEFIGKIRNIDSIEEYQNEILEKMNECSIEIGKNVFDKEKALKSAQKFRYASDLQKAQARAKIVFDEGLYNAYVEFQNDMIKGREDGAYNFQLIDMLNQRKDTEPYIYETIMKYMKLIATAKKDSNLMRIYEHFQSIDREDDVVKEEEQERKRKLEDRNQKIEIAKTKRKEERDNLTEEELGEARKKEPISLFEMLTEICKEENEQNLEGLKEKIFDFLGNQIALSEIEIERMLIDVDNSINNHQLEMIFANKICELAEERGIDQKLRDPNKFILRAKMRTRTRNYKNVETNFNGYDSIPSRVYAMMFCEEGDRKDVFKLVQNLSADNPKPPFDFSVLEKIEKIDSSFYRSMIRNIGMAAKRTNNPELKEIYDTLVSNEEAKQIREETDDLEAANIKAQIIFDECLYNRYDITSTEIVQGSPDGVYDIDLIEMIRERNTEIYNVLMTNIDKFSRQREDKNLRTVYEMFRKKDEKEKEQTQEIDDTRREIKIETEPDMHKKVGNLEVGNIFVAPEVSEIVVSHTDSERLVRKEKNQQGDTVGEGR